VRRKSTTVGPPDRWAHERSPNQYGEQYCALIMMNCTDYGHYLYVDRLIIPG
jgi:hypothetical protein